MDFAEAVEFSKKFSMSHPKVFIGFAEWNICDTETEGYVVLADAGSARGCFDELEEYVKSHKLRIDRNKDYLMIYTAI